MLHLVCLKQDDENYVEFEVLDWHQRDEGLPGDNWVKMRVKGCTNATVTQAGDSLALRLDPYIMRAAERPQ